MKRRLASYFLAGCVMAYFAVRNTLEAGWTAPERWYGLVVHGKPYWRHLKRR